MELYPAEVESLKRLIEEWYIHDERELEATFSGKTASETTTFLAVAQRLESKGFRALPQEDRLNIITPEQVRFTITGMGNIENYCRSESLENVPYEAMIKDRAGAESNVDIKEYDVRVKVRREIKLAGNDPVVNKLIGRWAVQKKAFRIMRRWTFLDEKGGVRFDLSMVRSSAKDSRKNYQMTSTFKEQDITNSPASYELEVELLRPEGDVQETPEQSTAGQAKALKDLIRGVGEILRGIQKHSILIRKSTAAKVLEGYTALAKTDRFRGVAPITMLLENMTKERKKGVPNIRDGYNVTDKADGLRMMGYCDDEGELFMIDMSLNVYRTGLARLACANALLDGEFVTRDRENKPVQQFMTFDCYIGMDKKDVTQLPFASQREGATVEGADRRDNSRYGAMMSWIERWNAGEGPAIMRTAGITERNKILVSAKNFLFASAGDLSVFQASARILDSSKVYHTDGLILTPNSLPLPQKPGVKFAEQLKWKPSHENTVDFLILFDKDTEQKRLDAVYTGVKGSVGGAGGGATVQYKTMHLYVGSDMDAAYEDPRGTVLFEQPLPGMRQQQMRGPRRREYKPVLFNPTELPDTMANTCFVEIEQSLTGEDAVVRCENGDPIEDRSIVEMRYEPKNDEGWRWIPMRIRYDKTERFQRGEIGRTLNKDEAAEGVWNSIHEPVTQFMIRTGSEQPSAAELAEIGGAVAALASGEIGKVYYERKGPKKDLMIVKGLREFHRRYIKESILLARGLRGGGKSLVDLACGQGGDLWSWVNFNTNFVYGTDIAGNGIRDPHDGAYRRYLNAVMKYGGYENVARMIFTIGSSAKNLATGEAGANSEEANIMRSVLGRVAPDGPVPPFVKNYGAGRLRDGADCVAIMFAIHYFFETEASLAGFMRNVSDCLKLGGLFVGCCFDGQKVFDALRAIPEGGSLKGEEAGAEVWRITKKYTATDLTNGVDSIGLPIDVKFVSIGTEQREYLVSFDLLKAEMAKIGCDLLTPAECKELGLMNSTETFEDTFAAATKRGEKFPMTPVVRQYSFFNRWFIFKRRRGLASAEVEEEVKAEAEESRGNSAEKLLDEALGAPAAVPPPQQAKKTYPLTQLFQFYMDASLADKLKIGDPGAARWLAPSAQFPIKDKDDDVVYPSIEHYMAGMKYKLSSNNPNLGPDLFSSGGTIHQEFQRIRATETAQGTRALTDERERELLKQERAKVQLESSIPAFKKYRTSYDSTKWMTIKDSVLKSALEYRWEHDVRLRKIIEAAKVKGLYLLYYTGTGTGSELGGKRTTTGAIDGENKVGEILMRLAKYTV
uniref:mRNA (guanine-N(7))-methyltransferase n=1 Tax=viral metagenome TaxID=1070528 RepID=A0A6C0KPY8_9ZZZZ